MPHDLPNAFGKVINERFLLSVWRNTLVNQATIQVDQELTYKVSHVAPGG